jgi:hypothetical protein
VRVRSDKICALLQEIGFPAVRLKPVSADVIGYNELFSSIVNPPKTLRHRLWFVKGVLPFVSAVDRPSWEVAFAGQLPVQVQVEFESVNGRAGFEMRSLVSSDQKNLDRSIVCVFVPLTTPIFERVCGSHLVDGRELERARMRNELHRGVSQQLLGAAFGCKVLAGKVATLSEGLGKEALDLAELLNAAVIELQSLVQSGQISQKICMGGSPPGREKRV